VKAPEYCTFTAFDPALVPSAQLFKPLAVFNPSGRSNSDGNNGIFRHQKKKLRLVCGVLQITFTFWEDTEGCSPK